jgi:hypothetical protein
MTDAATMLEDELEKLAEKDRECRRIDRAIRAETAMIEDLVHRYTLELARLRTSREGLQRQMHTRRKWLKSVAADNVRERLGIDAIPGYLSPVDVLIKRRLEAKATRRAEKLSTPTNHDTTASAS